MDNINYDNSLFKYISRENELFDVKYVKLGKTAIRLLIYSEEFMPQLYHQMGYTLLDDAEDFQYTIVLWKEKHIFGVRTYYKKDKQFELMHYLEHTVILYDEENKVYYFGAETLEPEELVATGHIFVQLFSRILNMPSTHLVHGACVGSNNNGILVCARGHGGKSTLTVLSMLEGMEYVSDDYLVLERENDKTYASPIYSIITLSPRMYNEMFDKLEGCRFLSNNSQRNKYVLNISNFHDHFRSHYPVKACMFPEITDDPEPSIHECTGIERGKAIIQITHSTFLQSGYTAEKEYVKKLLSMISDLPFYYIRLSNDIHKNVECLKDFANNIK